jgi:hypothetical protein
MAKQLNQHIDQTAIADLPAIRKKLVEYEKFLMNTDESSGSILPSQVAVTQDFSPIDYATLRKDLLLGNDDVRKCAIMHALRKRLMVQPSSKKLAVMDEIISADALGFKDNLFSALMSDGCSAKVLEQGARLLNVMSSEFRGRSYLLIDNTLIATLVQILKSENGDTLVVQNTIAVL